MTENSDIASGVFRYYGVVGIDAKSMTKSGINELDFAAAELDKNQDASRRHSTRPISIGHSMGGTHATFIMAKGKQN